MTRLPDSFLAGPIAHRGLHDRADGRPENSLAAFRAAIALGVGIELDVQPSAEGTAMVFHDDTLDRLTAATGPIAARPKAELSALPLTGGREGIPTLDKVLTLVAGQVPLLIEIKDQDGDMGPDVGRLERDVARALDGYAGDVALMSFNPHSVAALARLCPSRARGLVTSAYEARHWPDLSETTRTHLREIPDLDRVAAGFISHEVAALTMPRVAEIKRAGLPVLCWTVRSRAQEAQARQIADTVTFEGYLP
ncbi:glycerophosphodiester phosphodiesterase family protein [Jannaschia sp. M317]|uniref:glycerophosphodiester phosphodiesterase family protein n=1 Tax=Jannaschia sp. M317 TaxID=2867011 RepID=UPI0021A3D68A|nr:glycerophosphodiester phosphodiesterase family protein [Jannaschia sp. M317]UWQ18508.1 phosphodiesterase [Jannaschia sp. M317]